MITWGKRKKACLLYYCAIARMYNVGVAPVAAGLKWLFVLLDFGFRAIVPLWNGWSFLLSQILQRLIVPYSFGNVETLPELLQAIALALGTLGQSLVTWLANVQECTLLYKDAAHAKHVDLQGNNVWHVFHRDCLRAWQAKPQFEDRCPTCKQPCDPRPLPAVWSAGNTRLNARMGVNPYSV